MWYQYHKDFKNKDYNDIELDKIKSHKMSVCTALT